MCTQAFLDILACPACKGALTPIEETSALFCPHCSLKFFIRDGIPIMLIDEAERVT